MFIVTVKSIDADSFALPTLYGKTMLQNYIFSSKSARGLAKNLFDGELAPMSSKPFFPCYPYAGFSSHVMPTRACVMAGIYGRKSDNLRQYNYNRGTVKLRETHI